MTQRLQVGFVFIIMNMGFGYLLYPSFIFSLTKTGHWAVVLSYCLLQLILILVYKKGLDYFPKKNVIDIFLIMGRWAAFLFLIPYVIILIAMVAMNLRVHSEVINSIFLIRTPFWAILVLLFIISTYTAIKGLGTILRSSVVIFFIVNFLVVFNISSSVVNMDFQNASPAWPSSLDFLLNYKFFHILGFSSILFLGFVPSESNLTFRQVIAAWAYVMFFFLTFVYVPLFIFGQETVVTFPSPAIEAADSVDIGWFVFKRQAMFLGFSLIGFTTILNAIFLWKTGQIMQKMFNWQRSKASYWISVFSLIAFIFALFVPNQAMVTKIVYWGMSAQAYTMVILPFTILIYGVFAGRGMSSYEKK